MCSAISLGSARSFRASSRYSISACRAGDVPAMGRTVSSPSSTRAITSGGQSDERLLAEPQVEHVRRRVHRRSAR